PGAGLESPNCKTQVDARHGKRSTGDPFLHEPRRRSIAYATLGKGPPLVKAAHWLCHLEFDVTSPVRRHWLIELGRQRTFVRYDQRGWAALSRVSPSRRLCQKRASWNGSEAPLTTAVARRRVRRVGPAIQGLPQQAPPGEDGTSEVTRFLTSPGRERRRFKAELGAELRCWFRTHRIRTQRW